MKNAFPHDVARLVSRHVVAIFEPCLARESDRAEAFVEVYLKVKAGLLKALRIQRERMQRRCLPSKN